MASNAVNQSVERACFVLELFTPFKSELSLAEIADECAVAVTTIMPVLKSLENAGLLERNSQNKKYRLGMKFVEKGQLVLSGIDFRELSSIPLRNLAAELEATTHLGVLDGGEVVIIDRYDRKKEWIDSIVPAFIGKRLSAENTALGMVMLSYNKTEAFAESEKIINLGFAIDDEKNQPNGLCVAAPIFSHSGKVEAAISVSMIKTKERINQLDGIIEKVRAVAAEISYKMGYRK